MEVTNRFLNDTGSDEEINPTILTTTADLSGALNSGLKIHYTFDNVTNQTVWDQSGSAHNATLVNEASVIPMGKYRVLSLGNGTGYLDMGESAGNVISSLSNYTVSVYYRVDEEASLSGNGYFLWAFSTLASNSEYNGLYMAYRLNAERFALSTGGWRNEKAIQTGQAAPKGTWQHALYRQNGTTGELYIDGELVGTHTSVPLPINNFTTSPSCNWIGRAPFSADNYLKNTLVYDFRLYDQAIDNTGINELAALSEDLNNEYEFAKGIKIHYTFDNVTDQTVSDKSGLGNDGTLMNEASVIPMGKYNVLSLGNGTGYLDMGQEAGNIISSLNDYTVSAYYRVDENASLSGSGYFLWAFSTLASNGANDGLYMAYRLNAQRFALSTGGYKNEKAIEKGGTATKSTWQHILYRQNGATGELYLDGELVGTNNAIPSPASTFTSAPAYNWIGRAPFSVDNYLKNTLVYDFRIYDQAASDEQIAEWATQTEDLNNEYENAGGLKIHYTFDHVTGNTVTDESGSGNNGTLMNDASILSTGKYNVLNLGNGTGYLDMGQDAGSLLPSMKDYTVSVYYRVGANASLSGNGYFLWAFSTLASNASNNGAYMAYRLNAQRFAVTVNGHSNEKAIQIGTAATKSAWQHILYRQNGTTGELYLDGELIGTSTNIPLPDSAFTTAPAYNWIGRAPFNGDNYLKNTLVYGFQLYDEAVAENRISELAALTEDLNHDYYYGTSGDFSQLSAYITQYNALLAGNLENYPPMAIEEFRDAISMAQEQVNTRKGSQFLIDEFAATLTAAHDKFLTTEGLIAGAPSNVTYDTDKGFRHPGALHTQEDFDRVKALLAANDPTAVAAYNKLTTNGYSQSNVATYPTEYIVRGGGVGENYMNAARGAAMAYQNALRWKISGDAAHAERAVLILNSWANTCKGIGGDSNYALAAGLYGYGFANAAELVRDYEGWQPEDFKKVQDWMRNVWYSSCIGFLRGRNGTWEQGRPGHYWTNWGLCNALAVMSIGILCDDVFIYNQGLSFYKYDQVGSFSEPRTAPILNNGLTEFIGNLVPDVHEDDRGPYGYLGQMQESGRDQGHALMALGLAADVCQIGWSQGDDLFSLMNNRLAAGVEFVAAYNSGIEELPWTEYWYQDVRTAIHNSWKMYGNNDGGRGAFRPYWDRIIGHYEGIKGVSMPFSQVMKALEPVDNGGGAYGQTSGGFDHLGFSTLMNARPAVTPAQAPVLITPTLIYNGITYQQNELGGLVNTFQTAPTTAIPAGSSITLIPQLPGNVTNTGNWKWDSGETSQTLQVTVHTSALYRVTYTHSNGVKSTQVYSIAVKGDCLPDQLVPAITADGATVNDTVITLLPRTTFTLDAASRTGWGTYLWNNGATSSSIEVKNIDSDRTYTVVHTNQGGKEARLNFHIRLSSMLPSLSVDSGVVQKTNTIIVNPGQSVELIPMVPEGKDNGIWRWSDGSTHKNLRIENVQHTGSYSVTYTYGSTQYTLDYQVYVTVSDKQLADGIYYIKNASDGTYLTNDGSTNIPAFQDKADIEDGAQIWTITKDGARYKIVSLLDSRYLNEYGVFGANTYYAAWNSYSFHGIENLDVYAIQNGGSSGTNYWTINSNGSLSGKGGSGLNGYPFEIVSANTAEIEEAPKEEALLIYPNPVQDYLIVTLSENDSNNALFTLLTADGKVVKTVQCTAGENQIQASELPSGVYFGVLSANGQKRSAKIIKK